MINQVIRIRLSMSCIWWYFSRKNKTISDTDPTAIPRKNLPRFHVSWKKSVTPYPHRYIGRSATQNARNEKNTICILFPIFHYLIFTDFPWFSFCTRTRAKKSGNNENIDPEKEKKSSDNIREKLRICYNESTKNERKKSKELHRIYI